MFDFLKRLIKDKKVELEQIVFLDFSLNYKENIDYKILLSEYRELFPDKKPFFIFDEIQDI
jgi:predicted AAA+ superfamily ATPase